MKIFFSEWLGGAALFAATLNLSAYAGNMDWVNDQLGKFNEDPKAFSNDHKYVAKHDPETGKPLYDPNSGEPLLDESTGEPLIHPVRFSKDTITPGNPNYREYIFQKDQFQKSAERNKERKEKEGRAEIRGNDRPQDLVDELRYTNISQMNGFMSAQVETSPWSDDYWAIYKGVIAARYNDKNFPGNKGEQDWKAIVTYIEKVETSLDDLSPAEKYDLIVGDKNWSLTNAMINQGRGYYSPGHPVETWMGICHGWAPGSIRVPRPTNAIQVHTASGLKMNVYPSDIKALASLLWANGTFAQKFIGGRCNEKSTDPKTGRVLSQSCFDTNPGTWHQVVVNQIGALKRSFVLDATWDYEVWNQPAFGYEYVYFNPLTGAKVDNWKAAVVPAKYLVKDSKGFTHATYKGDKFSAYRSSAARYFVGVAMKFVYIAETQPSHNFPDGPNYDRKVAVNYLYDLELDKNLNIIGGEWYHNEHPDFLWAPTHTSQALSIGDEYLNRGETWNGVDPMPATWTEAAVYAAQKKSQPLAGIVNALVARAIAQ